MNFVQGARAWRTLLVGVGRSTMHQAGCLVCCVAEAAVRQGTAPTMDPPTLNALGVTASAFVGSNAVVPLLAPCAGLQAPRDRRAVRANGDDEIRKAIRRALGEGWGVILHVNHDDDPDGDHFLYGFAFAPSAGQELVSYADPATGKEGTISLDTLEGAATWGRSTYRVVGAVPIGPERNSA